ncbi:hypothetical protein ACLBR5_23605 [Escherichia coli]
METAYATAVANLRTESRGASPASTSRIVMMKTGCATPCPESESMTRRSVSMEPKLRPAFPPKIRTY